MGGAQDSQEGHCHPGLQPNNVGTHAGGGHRPTAGLAAPGIITWASVRSRAGGTREAFWRNPRIRATVEAP